MNEKLEEVKNLSNNDLLELYESMVRVNHYNPHETPEEIVEMRKAGISYNTVGMLILERMKEK